MGCPTGSWAVMKEVRSMLRDILAYEFLRNALGAGILASLLAGLTGLILVEKKMIMMSGGIAHASYGGVGLGYLLGFPPLLGAFGFSITAALASGFIRRRGGTGGELVIGLFWSLGMALGIFFVALIPGYPPNLSGYLFGNILAAGPMDLLLLLGLFLLTGALFAAFWQAWKAYLFDEEFSRIRGLPVVILESLLLILISLAVVALIRIVGIILAQALLLAPAATARLWLKSLRSRIAGSMAVALASTLGGLALSYYLDLPSGALIVLVAVTLFAMSYGLRGLWTRRQERKVL